MGQRKPIRSSVIPVKNNIQPGNSVTQRAISRRDRFDVQPITSVFTKISETVKETDPLSIYTDYNGITDGGLYATITGVLHRDSSRIINVEIVTGSGDSPRKIKSFNLVFSPAEDTAYRFFIDRIKGHLCENIRENLDILIKDTELPENVTGYTLSFSDSSDGTIKDLNEKLSSSGFSKIKSPVNTDYIDITIVTLNIEKNSGSWWPF